VVLKTKPVNRQAFFFADSIPKQPQHRNTNYHEKS
jgi:hypothetical protein